jgi:hypothetical protein
VRCARHVPSLSTEEVSACAEEQILMEDLNASEDLSYQEYPVNILEMFERVT